MKKIGLLIIISAVSTMGFAQADGSFTVNPKVGINFSGINDQPEYVSTNNKVGYNAGIDVRIGEGIVFLQPGIFFYQYNQEYTIVDFGGTTSSSSSNIKVQSLKVPVQLGFRLFSSDAVLVRANAGPAFNFPINVRTDDDAFAIRKDNYKGASVGAVLGAGIDLAFLTFDFNYEFGLSDYMDFSESNSVRASSSKQYVLSLNVGIKF